MSVHVIMLVQDYYYARAGTVLECHNLLAPSRLSSSLWHESCRMTNINKHNLLAPSHLSSSLWDESCRMTNINKHNLLAPTHLSTGSRLS